MPLPRVHDQRTARGTARSAVGGSGEADGVVEGEATAGSPHLGKLIGAEGLL
jgi:hypothetical protein